MRAKKDVSPYWVYCLAKDENFRSYAISSMVGSSGRERVHEDYLNHYLLKELDYKVISDFHNLVTDLPPFPGFEFFQLHCLNLNRNLLCAQFGP